MSHSKEREEKICLNCSTELIGRFCHLCGQENLEPKQTVWGIVSHFLYDITHFDGKFFSTVGRLVTKPGFLSKEFIRGRRASYLNPIKMYVFSSAVFFTIFYSYFNPRNIGLNDSTPERRRTDSSLIFKKEKALQGATTKEDSVMIERMFASIETYAPGLKVVVDEDDDTADMDSATHRLREKQMALRNAKSQVDSQKVEAYYTATEAADSAAREGNQVAEPPAGKKGPGITFLFSERYKTRSEYDSVQKALPPAERDGWFKRLATYRGIQLSNKYGDDAKRFLVDIADKFAHTLPYLLFVSLPLYALFLKLLYIRRKQFYYVDHGIFLVHLYIFTFLFLLVFFSLMELNKLWDTGWIWLVEAVLILYGIYYTVKAMRNFYGQGRGKTILKFIILNILAFFTLIILFILFFILTVFRV